MLIVLEGPDLGGKSTIGRLIASEFGVTPKHFGGPPKTVEEVRERIAAYKDHSLFDRHSYISELIYPTCMGRVPMVNYEEVIKYFEDNRDEIIILFCICPLRHLETQFHYLLETDKPYKTKQHAREVVANYKCIFSSYEILMDRLVEIGVTVHQLDFRTTTNEDIRRLLHEHLGR